MASDEEIQRLIRDQLEEKITPIVQKVVQMVEEGRNVDQIEDEIVDDIARKIKKPERDKIFWIYVLW